MQCIQNSACLFRDVDVEYVNNVLASGGFIGHFESASSLCVMIRAVQMNAD